MEIIRKKQAIRRDKGEGTVVDYYIFPEYEIHFNSVAPGTLQQWHHHNRIEETLIVVSGSLEAHWRDSGRLLTAEIGAGDIARVGQSVHTFANTGPIAATFLVFRLVLDGTDKRELMRADKVVDADCD